jgi:hypothetical protein
LRNRGAELSEALAEQKRLSTAEREHWNEEFKQIRRAVEKQSELLVQRPAAAMAGEQPVHVAATRAASSPGVTSSVIGSVLEQFEMLQKSKIRKLASTSS